MRRALGWFVPMLAAGLTAGPLANALSAATSAPAAASTLAAMAAPPAMAASAPADQVPRAALEGEWEAVIASPRRPWNLLVRFKPDGAGWTGGMSLPGLADLTLSDVAVEAGRLRFRLPPELDAMRFEGAWENGTIAGRVMEAGRTVTMTLTRPVPLPAPADRVEAWRQDLEFAATRLARYDRSFGPEARRRLRRDLDRLEHEAPRMSDAEILAALSRAVALGGNAHTRLRLAATSQGVLSTLFPIRFWWFSDGPYVVRAAPEYVRALGARVVAVGGHPISRRGRGWTGCSRGTPGGTTL